MKTLNPAKRTTTNRKRLFERVEGLKGRVDRNAGVIHGVKILGRESKNGRTYSDKALDDAARLYEGVKVNVDHPSKDRPNAERGFMEGFGELRNVQRKGDGVYGDLHFLKSHPSAEVICEAAERFPGKFGLSHNADGVTSQGRDGKVMVESIEIVTSVDIVGRPATNNGLFESIGPKVTLKTVLQALGFGPELRRVLEEDMPIADADGNGVPDDEEGVKRNTTDLQAPLLAAIASVFHESTLTPADMLAKIRAILKLQDRRTVDDNGGEADPADEGKSFTESIKSGSRPAYNGITARSSVDVPCSPFLESLNRKHVQKMAERRQRAIQNGSLREYREDRQQDHQPSSSGEAYYMKTPAELAESLKSPDRTLSPWQARLEESQRRRHSRRR